MTSITPAPYRVPEATTFRTSMVAGQRVLAVFDTWEPAIGIVSRDMDSRDLTVRVQFEPAGAHYGCYRATPQGDRTGWTEREYRIAREAANILEHAGAVERERRERYPEAAFSMYRPDNPRCQK